MARTKSEETRLAEYRSKRSFASTPEPSGGKIQALRSQLRFVIQLHEARSLHYDLRLELDGVFKSWAIPRGPSLNPKDKRLAIEVEDHPLEYGDFEGVIPKGQYGGGTVKLWDHGFWIADGDPFEGLKRGDLKFSLQGERLQGSWVLVRIKKDRKNGKHPNWLLIKHQDDNSNVLKTTEMPLFIEPQLCKPIQRPTSEPGWIHEIKFDGYRMQLRIENGHVELHTRKGFDWTKKLSGIADSARILPDCLLDGEIVSLDTQNAPDFAALQAALDQHTTDNLVFFAFDALFIEGNDLRRLPLGNRKSQLKKLLAKPKPLSNIRYVEHFESAGETILNSACKMQLEGIVSKRLESLYKSGRGMDWTKAKCRGQQLVVIGGWTSEGGLLRALLAGVHRGKELVYVGRVGSGFTAKIVRQLSALLNQIESKTSPFATGMGARKESNVHWARPELMAEIEFSGWTGSGKLRHASFRSLSEDKPDAGVVPMILGVSITSSEKPLWPDEDPPVTKGDLARYYELVGDWLIDHIKGRPCSIVRTPDGITGDKFFQRHAMPGFSNLVELITVQGDRKPYLQINRVEALVAVAQFSAVELHPWNCQPGEPDLPGRLVFDLDPAPDVPFGRVIKAAIALHTFLEEIGLTAFCKTTGGKGLHIVTPLALDKKSPDWGVAKTFAQEICRRIMAADPDHYIITMAKKDRSGRIYLDYLRNDRMATAVAPLSPRAREGAPVSMPIDWPQVRQGLDPGKFTVRTAPKLLRLKRPWKDYAESARPFRQAIEQLLKTK